MCTIRAIRTSVDCDSLLVLGKTPQGFKPEMRVWKVWSERDSHNVRSPATRPANEDSSKYRSGQLTTVINYLLSLLCLIT